MSRDALLIILAIVVIANFVFLAEVAVLNRRRSQREGVDARNAAAARVGAASAALATAAAEPVPQLGPRLVPAASTESLPASADLTAATAATVDQRETPAAVAAGPRPVPVAAAASPAVPPVPAGEPMTRRSRTRRFAMPQLDEDRGRTEAAINAFLGEPSLTAGTPQQHRPRRRSRRQRAPTDTAPMVVVATLAGWEELRRNGGAEAASRFGEALASTLRGTLRSGDELMELGGGRLRMVVHADEDGARAIIVRAIAICDPWLRAAPVKLELRARAIDPAASSSASASAAASIGTATATATRPAPSAPLPFPGPAARHRSGGGMAAPGEPH
ncbi:MAG: hypothetical protein ACJ77B_09425 [Chloroflexota bacterium]